MIITSVKWHGQSGIDNLECSLLTAGPQTVHVALKSQFSLHNRHLRISHHMVLLPPSYHRGIESSTILGSFYPWLISRVFGGRYIKSWNHHVDKYSNVTSGKFLPPCYIVWRGAWHNPHQNYVQGCSKIQTLHTA